MRAVLVVREVPAVRAVKDLARARDHALGAAWPSALRPRGPIESQPGQARCSRPRELETKALKTLLSPSKDVKRSSPSSLFKTVIVIPTSTNLRERASRSLMIPSPDRRACVTYQGVA